MSAERSNGNGDAGIRDLVRQLGDDSRQLAVDELRLAKLEIREIITRAGHGATRLAIAFAIAIVTLVALTVFLVTLIGRVAAGHLWVGLLVTGLLELATAALFVKKSVESFTRPAYSLPATRASLKDSAHWVRHPRR